MGSRVTSLRKKGGAKVPLEDGDYTVLQRRAVWGGSRRRCSVSPPGIGAGGKRRGNKSTNNWEAGGAQELENLRAR